MCYCLTINGTFRKTVILKRVKDVQKREVDRNHKIHLHQRNLGTSRNFAEVFEMKCFINVCN